MPRINQADRAHAIEELRKHLPPGSTAYTILRHCSRSGMSRRISVVVIKDGEHVHLDWLAARALGWPCSGNGDGIKVSGCGMDMGFHLVYSLSSILYRPDDRAGYTIKHRWL